MREIAANNMLPGSTDVEAEFTTRDSDPLVSGITSYGSANNATGDAYGAEVTYLPLAKLDDNVADAQAGNGSRQFCVPNERDDAADDAGEQEGDIKRVPIVDTNAAQDADEIVACANLECSKEQVTTANGMGMSAAPIMGTTSAVFNDPRLQQPLLGRKDHVQGQEGGTKDAPIVDLNVVQEAGELVQLDEEVSVRIAYPYAKSTETPLGKLYESYDTLPPDKHSGECAPCYEEHNAMLEITDYDVPELNTSGMEETSVGTLQPIPSADVQVWFRGLEPTNGGTVFPSEVLPTAYTTGRVMRVIPPRLSSSATEDVPITSVEDRADLHAPCGSGGGIAAALVGMSPIMLGSLAADAYPLQLDETKLKVLWTGTPDKVDVGSLIITMVIDVQMDLLTESICTIWD